MASGSDYLNYLNAKGTSVAKAPLGGSKTGTTPQPLTGTSILGNPTTATAAPPTSWTKPPATVTSSPTVTGAGAPVSTAQPVPPTVAPPVAPPPPGTTTPTDQPTSQPQGNEVYDDSAYRAAREAELAAALKALESQYNLSREQLLADQTEAGDQYRFIMSALQRSKEEAILGAQSGALQRGVLRSGIYLGDEAKVNQQFASQESAASADKAAKLNAIQMAIADLEAQFATGQASTATGVVQAQLASMKELANSLALDDALGERAAAAGYTPAGQGAPAPIGPTGSGSLPNTTDAFNMRMQASGQGFGLGDFLDSNTGQPGSPGPMGAIIPNIAGNQQGAAYFGQAVDPTSFYNSLAPEVQAGITPQDLLNIAEFYGGVIPSDAAYGIAARAALIGSTNQLTA